MKPFTLALAGAALSAAAFAAVVQYLTCRADTLRHGALFCERLASYQEATQAVAANDANWTMSVPRCILTNAPYKARAVSCGVTMCVVRLWLGPDQTALGYTSRRDLTFTP